MHEPHKKILVKPISLRPFSLVLSLLFSLLMTACGTGSHRPHKIQGDLSIATYNVDKLVESSRSLQSASQKSCDRLLTDGEMLKCLKADWSEEKLNLKLKRVAETILTITPRGPDILVLQEVESLKILNQRIALTRRHNS